MIKEEIKNTPVWELYERGREYHRRMGIYSDTDRNYRMYNGDQWGGAKLGDIEPVQKNFIRPIVKYKCSVIHSSLYAVNYMQLSSENSAYNKTGERICRLLNRYAASLWERDKMDKKGRRITKDAAINDEGVLYVSYDSERNTPVNEIVKKCDVYYGNECEDDIESQPYILIRKRVDESAAREIAESYRVPASDMELIRGDEDCYEESGESAKDEKEPMVTLVYKFYKMGGRVHYSLATRHITLVKDQDMGIRLYPVAHFVWEEKEGSARGEGEVRYLIPNQIEVNKTEMRRVLTVKTQAYPQKVANTAKIANPSALGALGGIIKTNDLTVDDVHKIFTTIPPAQMSPDVVKLQDDLINVTRELAGAGDIATGQVNPESASGRAILAVQQASEAPMTEQRESYKSFIEDVGRIWLEYFICHSDKLEFFEEWGGARVERVRLPRAAFAKLSASVKIEVTPMGVYDRFAREQTLENFLTSGLFNPERICELRAYVNALPEDSVAPKSMLQSVIMAMENESDKISEINTKAQLLRQRAERLLAEEEGGRSGGSGRLLEKNL